MEQNNFLPLDIERRLLYEESDVEGQSSGIHFLMILGTLYLLGCIYLLSIKYLNHIIEDLVYLADYKGEYQLPPFVYCGLNSLLPFIFCLISVFQSKSDLAVSYSIGSDYINIFLIYSIILIRVILKKEKTKKEGRYLDPWAFFRDSIFYIITMGILSGCFFLNEQIYWFMSFIMMCVGFAFFWFQNKDEEMKTMIYTIIGIRHEDDSFDSEEYYKQVRFRDDLDYLIQRKFFNLKDPKLHKKFNCIEVVFKVNLGTDNPRTKIMIRWHKAVQAIIFARRNKIQYEKNERSKYYASLWKKQDGMEIDEENDSEEDQSQGEKQVKSPLQNDNQSLLQNNRNNEQDGGQLDQNNQQEEEEEEEQIVISLSLPQPILEKIMFIIFYPCNLIIYLLPNYHVDTSVKKLILCFILNIILIGVSLVFIDNWMGHVSIAFGIRESIIGIFMLSVGIQIPFLIYNMSFISKDSESAEFLQSFIQLGIFKTAFCIGFSWLADCVGNNQPLTVAKVTPNLNYVPIFGIIGVFIMQVSVVKLKFQVNYTFAKILLAIFFMILIANIIVLAL